MPYTKKYEKTLYDRTWLYEKYVVEDKNAAQVAALVGCNKSAVLGKLRQFGIPIKSMSEAQKVADHRRGSSAPRPRKEFLNTTHNPRWLKEKYVDKQMSLAEIGKLAGCSAVSVRQALDKFSIERENIPPVRSNPDHKKEISSPAAFGSRKDPSKMGDAHSRKVARAKVPPGPCVLCGREGQHVNHKDRDIKNADVSNLELVCVRCHSNQHAEEVRVAFEWLAERGVPFIEIHKEARRRLNNKLNPKSH